jgi:hypothetical protein
VQNIGVIEHQGNENVGYLRLIVKLNNALLVLVTPFYFKKSGQKNLKSWKYWGFKEKERFKI